MKPTIISTLKIVILLAIGYAAAAVQPLVEKKWEYGSTAEVLDRKAFSAGVWYSQLASERLFDLKSKSDATKSLPALDYIKTVGAASEQLAKMDGVIITKADQPVPSMAPPHDQPPAVAAPKPEPSVVVKPAPTATPKPKKK